MRILGLLLVVTVMLVGCADRQAAQQASAQAKFAEALVLMEQAGQGYVPVSGGEPTHNSLKAFRRAKHNEAAALLEEVIQLGSPTQKQGARSLLTEIHASAAREARREGMSAWADLANRSAKLISEMVAIQRSTSRAEALRVDDSLLLRNLEAERDKTSRQLAEYKRTLADLDQRIKDLQANIEQLETKRQQTVGRVQELRDEAFTASGSKRYELYNQAAAVQREAEKTGAEAEKLEVNLDIYQSERVILQRQIAAAERFLKSVTTQIEETRQRTSAMHTAAAESTDRRDQLISQLQQNVNDLAADYDAQVESKLDEAEQAISEAVSVAEAAVNEGGDSVRNARLELLSKVTTRVHILTSHVLAKGDLGETLAVIAVRAGGAPPLMPDQAESFQNSVTRIAKEQRALITESLDAIAQGEEIAAQLVQGATETDPVAAIARTQQSQLEGYRQRIASIRMTSAAGDDTASQ